MPLPFGSGNGRRRVRGGRELDIDRCDLRARLALRFGGDFEVEETLIAFFAFAFGEPAAGCGHFFGFGFSEESADPLAPLRVATCKQAPLMATTCAGDASSKIATHPAPHPPLSTPLSTPSSPSALGCHHRWSVVRWGWGFIIAGLRSSLKCQSLGCHSGGSQGWSSMAGPSMYNGLVWYTQRVKNILGRRSIKRYSLGCRRCSQGTQTGVSLSLGLSSLGFRLLGLHRWGNHRWGIMLVLQYFY